MLATPMIYIHYFTLVFQTVSAQLEIYSGDFWIYPTYFEVGTNEMIENIIIFQPSRFGLHLETLFIICDNNCVTELEIMGDALYFSGSDLQVDVR